MSATPIQTPQHCIAVCTSTKAPAWGCDISRTKEEAHRGVSIHAPTWGATFCSRIVRLLSPFQSTHPHGVRPAKAGELLPVYWFQSTHPHEVRPNLAHITIEVKHVSIHAPAWGATASLKIRRTKKFGFNPRTRMGCDVAHSAEVVQQRGFQSTHPHGVRPSSARRKRGSGCFNPRTRTGCDLFFLYFRRKWLVFQSTHPHGVRRHPPT